MGNYEIYLGQLLGSGNYGEVYESKIKNTQKKVAIKMIDKKL